MGIDKNQRAYSKEKYAKPKGKKRKVRFIMIGSEILNSNAYMDLSFSARSMLVEMLHYFTGTNNGRVWIVPIILASRGFSKNTTRPSRLDSL